MRTMTIGRLAEEAGVGVETVRFYERTGLLDVPQKKANGYRQYDSAAVERLRFIRRAKSVGFTLAEIRDLLELRDDPGARRDDVRRRARERIVEIDTEIRELSGIRRSLADLLDSCEGDGPASGCPIILSFDTKRTNGELT